MEPAEIKFLPNQQKKDLCLELLDEFGAGRVRVRGDELQHNCTLPFNGHNDNNSYAASVNWRTMAFNCFVCGYGGSVAWWIAVNRGEDVGASETHLKKRLGIGSSLDLNLFNKIIDDIFNPPTEKKILPKYPEKILDRWNDWPMFHPYLTDVRKIPEETLERFKVGYADEDAEFGYYNRIMVPVFWRDSLVGWQGRSLSDSFTDDPDFNIKYKNSPDFPRDLVLYGDLGARKAVLVESPMSVLRHIHQTPMVATLGSNVTDEQLRALERYDELVMFNENDKAGWKMIRRVSNALARKVRVNIVCNPYNKKYDPADLDDTTFMNLVGSAVPSSIWEPNLWANQIDYKESENN